MSKQTDTIKLFHLISTVHQALFRVSDQNLAIRAGISTTQNAVLMYLGRHGNASMGEIAAAVGIKLTSASGLIDRMVNKGLIKRTRGANDARTVVLSLTEKGIQVADQTLPWVKQANTEMLAAAGTPEEIQIFKTVCERLINGANDLSAMGDVALVPENTTDKAINMKGAL